MKFIENEIIEMTELESVLYCVKMNVSDGSELSTKAWVDRGCFKSNDGTHKRHIKNLERCAEMVGIEGTGKKRKYILYNPYKNPVDKIDGRSNNGHTYSQEELMLDEYIMSQISSRNFKESMTYNSWSKLLNIFDVGLLNISSISLKMKDAIDTLHFNTFSYDSSERTSIIEAFEASIKERIRFVIGRSFERLEKSGRILLKEEYNCRTINGSFKKLDYKTYNEIIEKEEAILDEIGLSRGSFVYQKIYSNHRDDMYYGASKRVSEMLHYQYGIQYYYITKLPVAKTLSTRIDRSVNAKDLFMCKFIELVEKRQDKYTFNSESSIPKKWHLANTLTLLNILGVSVPLDTLNLEIDKINKQAEFNFRVDNELEETVNDGCDFL